MLGIRRTLLPLVALLLPALALAQDQFSFMPPSGPELLAYVLETCDGCDDIETLAKMDLDDAGWQEYFDERDALVDLFPDEVEMLVGYLRINFPNARATATNLPRGGRLLTINNCQLCHSIAVPMTLDRELTRWMEHRSTVPHDSLTLSAREWDTIAHYLTIAAPLPLDVIPEQLRRGAGGY